MARETKAQREAREAAERQADWDKFREEYPQRFAKVLFEFAKLEGRGARAFDEYYYVGKVDDETYEFTRGNTECTLKTTAPVNRLLNVMCDLELLEREVQDYYDLLAEEQRQAKVKRGALAKLNAEERELLGL